MKMSLEAQAFAQAKANALLWENLWPCLFWRVWYSVPAMVNGREHGLSLKGLS